MDVEWIKHQLADRRLTQRELGDAIGLTEQKMSHVMRGRRRLTADEADRIRRFFGLDLPEATISTIAVAGKVGAGDSIELVDDFEKGAGLYHIARPGWVPPRNVCAAEVTGSSAEPLAIDGDVIFWRRDVIGVLDSDLGRPVVAETRDGRVWLKRLASGSMPGLWTLLSINPTHANLVDVRLKWASRVLFTQAKDCVRIIAA